MPKNNTLHTIDKKQRSDPRINFRSQYWYDMVPTVVSSFMEILANNVNSPTVSEQLMTKPTGLCRLENTP